MIQGAPEVIYGDPLLALSQNHINSNFLIMLARVIALGDGGSIVGAALVQASLCRSWLYKVGD